MGSSSIQQTYIVESGLNLMKTMKSKTQSLRIAFGIEARERPSKEKLIKYLENLPGVIDKGNYCYEYRKNDKTYDIRIIFTKKEFIEALNLAGAIVIYEGHSRYGQGPVFVEKEMVGACADISEFPHHNPWEDHVRMGWDVVETPCVKDILRHGTNPIEYTKTEIPKFSSAGVKEILEKASKNMNRKVKCDFHKILKKRRINDPRARTNDCYPSIAKITGCRKVTLNGRSYWRSRPRTKKEKAKFRGDIEIEFFTLVEAGSAADLKKSKLQCSVLYMKSCKSIKHFYCALHLRRKELQKEQRNRKKPCVFYLTSEPSHWVAYSPLLFVEMVLAGKNPTRTKDAKLICKKLNSVNSPTYRRWKIENASGIVRFSTGKGLMDWEKRYLANQRGSCKEAHWRDK